MTRIDVAPDPDGGFQVVVDEDGSQSRHRVAVPEKDYLSLTGGKISREECLRAAFRFLLDREPKESILREFDLPVIRRYFPEFDSEFQFYIA
jgi:hypothetical protein